jgi:hypothetical protein
MQQNARPTSSHLWSPRSLDTLIFFVSRSVHRSIPILNIWGELDSHMPKLESNVALNAKILLYLWSGAGLYLVAHFLVTEFSTRACVVAFMVVVLGLMKIACCLWWFARLSPLPARFRWVTSAPPELAVVPTYHTVRISRFFTSACERILCRTL